MSSAALVAGWTWIVVAVTVMVVDCCCRVVKVSTPDCFAVISLMRVHSFSWMIHDQYMRWPTIGLVVSLSALATYPIERASKWAILRRKTAANGRKIISRLHQLSPNERMTLSNNFIQGGDRCNNFRRTDPIVTALRQDGILFLEYADQSADPPQVDIYRIDSRAFEYLRKNPDLLKY